MPGLLLIVLVLAVLIAIAAFIGKVFMKGQMSGSLGRSVGDHELTSLNSWMDVHEKEDEKRAQAAGSEK
jgi:hypothetical protein